MEATYGTWNLPAEDVQLSAKMNREPLLSWSPSLKKKKYPMNYYVPSFGRDDDMNETNLSENSASESVGAEWNPERDEDGKWVLPSPQIEFKLAQTISKKI